MLCVPLLPHLRMSEPCIAAPPHLALAYTPGRPFSDNFFTTEALVHFFILRFPADPVGACERGDEKIDGAAWGYELVQKDSVGKTCHFRICAGNLTQMIRRTVGTFVKKWTVGKYCLK